MTPQDKKDWIEIIVSALEIYERQKEERLYHRAQKIEQELIQGHIKKHGQALAATEGNTVEATLEKFSKREGRDLALADKPERRDMEVTFKIHKNDLQGILSKRGYDKSRGG